MNNSLKWDENLVAEFIQTRLHIQESASFDLIEQFKASKQPKQVVFITDNGIRIGIGESYWYITKDFRIFEDLCDSYTGGKVVSGIRVGDKYFSTKEKAEEWLLWNKPVLTLNDVKKCSPYTTDDNLYYLKIIQIAKDKLNLK